MVDDAVIMEDKTSPAYTRVQTDSIGVKYVCIGDVHIRDRVGEQKGIYDRIEQISTVEQIIHSIH